MPYKVCFAINTVEDRNIINTFRFYMNELIPKPFHPLQSHHDKRKNGVKQFTNEISPAQTNNVLWIKKVVL
jgi:hypothetical protein